MAKRRATEQIRKDQASDLSSSSGDEDNQQQAAPEVLAARKIAVPRTRRNFQTSLNSEKPNPFGSMMKSSEPSSGGANPFRFLGGKSQPSSFTLSSTSVSGTTSKDLKFRGLNASFAAQISKANSESAFEDWSVMCKKYLNYAKSIAEPSKAPIVSKQVPASADNDESSRRRKDPPKSEINSSGFKFGGALPNNENASFSFGGKIVDFSKTPSSKPSGGFVFNSKGPGEINVPQINDTSMMNDANDVSEAESEAKNAAKAGDSSLPANGESKGSFLGSQANNSNATKPAFSFEAGLAKNFESKADTPKPLFSFGEARETPSKSAPFQFGSSALKDASKESAPLGTGSLFGCQQKSGTHTKPSFSFGNPGAIGSDSTNAPAASSTSFEKGSLAVEKPKPFTFGNSNAISTSPAFSFGGDSSNKSAAEKQKFNFGPTAQLNKPGFTFGTGSNLFATSRSGSTNLTSNSAGLDSSIVGPKSGNSGRLDATWNPSRPIKISSESEPGDPCVSSGAEATGDPSDEQNDPQTNLGGSGPGEEDEDSVYEKKSKIFEQIDGEFKPLGLGMLRVLVHKVSHKVRVLVRAEGSGRILLNIPIRKEFSYTAIGKGQVRAMDIKPGSNAASTYILRVKTEKDGNELAAKLEDVKS